MLALLGSTFITVFLAELGDKTQLAIVSISGTTTRPGAVFAGSAAALVLASLVGAAAGGSLSSVIPPDALQLLASVGFLILGTRLILRSSRSEDGAPPHPESGNGIDGGPPGPGHRITTRSEPGLPDPGKPPTPGTRSLSDPAPPASVGANGGRPHPRQAHRPTTSGQVSPARTSPMPPARTLRSPGHGTPATWVRAGRPSLPHLKRVRLLPASTQQ